MHLSQKEIEKLALHNAGFLAQKRYARGLQLNYVETVALLSAQVLEFIRDGDSVASLMEKGKLILGFGDVLPGVASLVDEVQVEGTFLDGTKLVTIHQPICRQWGDSILALHGSGLTRLVQPKVGENQSPTIPGEVFPVAGYRELNPSREVTMLRVTNDGDRPVQVGSHYPFFETNGGLRFDRKLAFGKRLDIPAGTAVRFEPGETKEVSLVPMGGKKLVYGGNALIDGSVAGACTPELLQKTQDLGFTHEEQV